MADTAEKPKEKAKKKKTTGSTKEKEKKATEKVTGTDSNKSEKQNEQTEQAKTGPQKTKEQQNTEEVKLTEQPKASQPSKDIQKNNELPASGPPNDDPKPATDKPQEPATDKPQAETSPAEKIVEQEFVPLDISDRPLIKPDYVPPPPATKKDVDLLKDLDEAKLEELREAFELFDLDKDGVINTEDLRLTFGTLGQPDIPESDIQQMLSETIGPLDFESFVILLGYKTIELDPETVLVDALSRWDYDNSGFISEERIKHDLVTWGDRFTPEEADLALDDAPVCMRKGVAMIDYIKFCNTLSGLRKKTKTPGPEDFMSQAH